MALKKYNVNIDLQQQKILNAAIDPIASDPISPVDGQLWTNTTENRMKFSSGGITRTLADLTDIDKISRHVGSIDAASITTTLAANYSSVVTVTNPDLVAQGDETVLVNIEAGDMFYVSSDGDLGAGLTGGDQNVQIGDLVIAITDSPTTNADFITINRNSAAEVGTATVEYTEPLTFTLGGGTYNSTVNSTAFTAGVGPLSKIKSWKIINTTTGVDETGSFGIQNYVSETGFEICSNVDVTGDSYILVGTGVV